jgi:uncharacterized protein (TIGR02001 family)
MKKLFLLVGILSLPTFASVSANVTVASDYVWRGLGQTDGKPAIQGGFDYSAESGFYAGVWGSNVRPEFGSSEFDYYMGYSTETEGGLGIDVGYISYMFDGVDDFGDLQEVYVGLSSGNFGFTFYEGLDDTEHYINLSYSISDSLSVSYGDWEDSGSDFLISYGFSCGSYDCSVNFADFSGNNDVADEDSFFFTVSASL